MKQKYNLIRILIILALFLGVGFYPDLVYSQKNLKASAPSTVAINNAFNYTISAEQQGKVSVLPPEGIRIISGPSQMVSYQSSNINGKLTTTTQVTYTFMMIAGKEGDYTIPPAVLTSGKKKFESGPVNIKVVTGSTSQNKGSGGETKTDNSPAPVILKLIPSRRELYEGEQLVVSTKIFVHSRNEMHALTSPAFEGFWVESLEPDKVAGNDVIEGYSYNSQVVRRELLTAQRKGNITIDPASLDVTILKRVRRSRGALDNFFNDPFFDDPFGSYERDRKIIKSNQLEISINPLPPGKPEWFNGAVGDFTVSGVLKSDSVKVNDAVSLVIKIKGRGNLNLLNPPEINFPPDLEVFEPKRSENISHNVSGTSGEVNFEYTIIPRHNGNYRISPLKFAYFDPVKKKYNEHSSNEFRFTAYGEVNQEGAVSTVNNFFRQEVKSLDTDIRYIKPAPANLAPVGSFLILQPYIWVIYIAGIIILLVALFLWRNKLKREADIFYVRNKKARRISAKRLKNANHLMQKDEDTFYEEILKAVWGYLSDRLGIRTADLSRERISDEMSIKGITGDIQELLWTVIDECEYSRYSPERSENKKELFDKAAECLLKIENKI